jgi:hypothetical protein
MRTFMILAGVLGALALPAAARAAEGTGSADRQNASQECRFERGTTSATREAFALKYGTNGKGKHAFGKCVSVKARNLRQHADAQDHKDAAARKNAAKQCDDERGTTAAGDGAFTAKYGTGSERRNAFGKCVSKLAETLNDDGQDA